MKIFGERVKKVLKEIGKTEKELAKAIHVQPSTLCEWLNGRNEPPMQAIVDIARFFGNLCRLSVGAERIRLKTFPKNSRV